MQCLKTPFVIRFHVMSEEDLQAIVAAQLYAEGSTFADISTKLGISKSHAQTLTRKGIELTLSEKETSNPGEVTEQDHDVLPVSELPLIPSDINPLQFPQLPQGPRSASFELITQGVPRRVSLTPGDLMIFNIWKGAGFPGDLSDFISDSINFLYDNVRPAER